MPNEPLTADTPAPAPAPSHALPFPRFTARPTAPTTASPWTVIDSHTGQRFACDDEGTARDFAGLMNGIDRLVTAGAM